MAGRGKALIFCSASNTIDPKYNQAARELVRAACLHGYDIVSGGTIKGTMRHVAEEAEAMGAVHEGILPRFMQGLEYPGLTRTVWTGTMSERKELMREGTDLAVALPGGIGTLDEFFETFTLAKLGRYHGKVIVFNFDGYYDDLRGLLAGMVEHGMLDQESFEMVSFPATVEEFEKLI